MVAEIIAETWAWHHPCKYSVQDFFPFDAQKVL